MGFNWHMEPLQINPKLLKVDELAEILQVSYARAAALIRASRIASVRIGRQIRVTPESVQAFIAAGGYSLEGGWRRDA